MYFRRQTDCGLKGFCIIMEDNNSDLLPYEYEELDNNSEEEDIGKIKRNILSKKGDKGEKSDDANESKISKLFDESHALTTRRRTTVPHVKLNEARFFSNLNAVMHKMELWAHQLYPSLRFDDVLERLEKLGHKKTVQTFLAKCREDAFRHGSDSSEGEAENEELSLKDLFFMDANKSNNYNDLSNAKNEVEKTEQTQLTEEQLARIEANRLRAKQLREQKQVQFVKSGEIAHDAAGNSDHNVQPVNISGGEMLTEAEIMAELDSD
ncbi:TIMELESS-interacting protein [Trichinella spiralis]|uniref:TIMELESS-interacting protein n=1 Tax=Trichinella spiralis TaxID=6334 RepID=UPI0001EFF01B|nr:TIMELESS-interacting protein [Trichinella spiralis]